MISIAIRLSTILLKEGFRITRKHHTNNGSKVFALIIIEECEKRKVCCPLFLLNRQSIILILMIDVLYAYKWAATVYRLYVANVQVRKLSVVVD